MNTPASTETTTALEVERAIAAARDSMTDEMVARLAATASDAMDLVDQVNRAGLSKAIGAIAELVNNGDLERVTQLARVYGAAHDAVTDEMVTRLTESVSGGLDLLDQVNRAQLSRAIPVLSNLVANGDLERIAEIARVISSAQDAITDEMVTRLAQTVGDGLSLVDRLNRGGVIRLVETMERLETSGSLERLATTLPRMVERLDMVDKLFGCLEHAAEDARKAPPSPGGVGGMWSSVSKGEDQDALRFLIALGKRMRTSCAATEKKI